MTDGEQQAELEPAPGFAHNVPPAPGEAVPMGVHVFHMPRAVSDKAWLGITSLVVGAGAALLTTVASVIVGLQALFYAPFLLFPFGIVTIVFGHLGLSDARRKKSRMGPSIAGLTIGYVLVGIFIAALTIIGFIIVVQMLFAGSANP